MVLRTSFEDDRVFPTGFDPNQIFIGREEQIATFEVYLKQWQQVIFDDDSDTTFITTRPSPDNKIQGLVVLLYGGGGSGKSTLLRRYRKIVLRDNQNTMLSRIVPSNVIDWEYEAASKRSIFDTTPQDIDASAYYHLLCGQLAIALNKAPSDFKEYQTAVKNIDKAKKKTTDAIESIQKDKDDRYEWLRGLTLDIITSQVRSHVPGSGALLDRPGVKAATDKAAKITQEQIVQLHAKLHDKLGSTFKDYLEADVRLGLALGRDLNIIARNFPLLIFFDTYEEIDEGDRLLRTVMGAAGLRVGWIIAGRDSLWTDPEQIKRSVTTEYGYEQVTFANRGLGINFNDGGIGGFTVSNIKEYFDYASEQTQFGPPPPLITDDDAKLILGVTKGVPLAVKIAAELYTETKDLKVATEKVENKRQIVDVMVRRYLMHAQANPKELASLYGLALLRRTNQPTIIAALLGLDAEQAKTNYTPELSRLHRRYSFIFTDKTYPSLHQQVRYFLRVWLLENCTLPEVIAVNEKLQEAHLAAIKKLEEYNQYASLKERLEDDEWFETYLDIIEQAFWLKPSEGVKYALPLMIASGIYCRTANRGVVGIGRFFDKIIPQPYHKHWLWATKCFVKPINMKPSHEEYSAFEELVKLVQKPSLRFPSSIIETDCQKNLEALLWWRFGEAHLGTNLSKAFELYERALAELVDDDNLNETTTTLAQFVAQKLINEKKYNECKELSDRAVEWSTRKDFFYSFRGYSYYKLKKYELALLDLNRTIELEPNEGRYYNNRANTYDELKNYEQALLDFNRAIQLDPNEGGFYHNRGIVYKKLKNYEQALLDFNCAIQLDPDEGESYNHRGIVYNKLKNYEQALLDFNHAIQLDPDKGGFYYNRGNCHIKLKNYEVALLDFNRAIKSDPNREDEILHRKAFAFYFLERFQETINTLKKVFSSIIGGNASLRLMAKAYVALQPQYPISNINIEILNRVGYTAVICHFNHIIKLNPANSVAISNRGRTYQLAGYPQEALKDFERLLSLSNSGKEEDSLRDKLRGEYGVTLSYIGRYQEAIKAFEQSLKKEPDDMATLYNLAVATARTKGVSQSKTYIEKAREILLNNVQSDMKTSAIYGLGGLEALVGNNDEALEYLQNAMSLDEDPYDWARYDSAWHDLRSDARFQAMISDTRIVRISIS